MTPAVIAHRRGMTLPGSLAPYVAVRASSLVRVPAHVGFEAAATLPISATTAWRAVRAACLGPGVRFARTIRGSTYRCDSRNR